MEPEKVWSTLMPRLFLVLKKPPLDADFVARISMVGADRFIADLAEARSVEAAI